MRSIDIIEEQILEIEATSCQIKEDGRVCYCFVASADYFQKRRTVVIMADLSKQKKDK